MFSFSKDGLTVSYQGKIVESVLRGVDPVETVMGDGTMVVSIDGSDTRTDILTNEQTMYINNTLNYDELGNDIQKVGNKVCEIYYGMIK